MQDQATVDQFAAELAMTPEAFAAQLRLRHLAGALLLVCRHAEADELRTARDMLCEVLEGSSAGAPMPPLEDAREDARWWAELASPHEIEAYLSACLRAVGARPVAMRARKRVFAALWETMPEDDRRAFIRRVDPQGRFHKGAA